MEKIMSKRLKLFFVFGFLLLALTACSTNTEKPQVVSVSPEPFGIIAEGNILPKDDMRIAFQMNGKVTAIPVQIGDKVTQGTVLARMGEIEISQEAVAAAEAGYLEAQQEYDRVIRTATLTNAQAWTAYLDAQVVRAEAEEDWEALNLDNIDDDIEDAEEDLDDYRADLIDAQEEFDKVKDLNEDSTRYENAKDDLENAQEDYNEAVRKLESIIQERDFIRAALDTAIANEDEAKRTYENSLDEPDRDQLVLAESRLNLAKAQLEAAKRSLSYHEIVAPFDGIITNINISVNEVVTSNTWVVSMADTSSWIVETSDLSELDVVNIKIGDPVEIAVDAIPETLMNGVVEEIVLEPVKQSGDVYYTVRIKLTDPNPAIQWGMTVEATFTN
jgi:multidrug resistance efflux pump